MKKNIYIIWLQGWNPDTTPSIVWECARSWIYRNPDWDVHLISDQNLKDYIELEYIEETKDITPIQARCDLLRYRILYNNPGLYVDATTFCLKPLDTWFNDDMIVENCFWITAGQESHKMKFQFGEIPFFDTDFVPCITFLYSDVEYNPVYNAHNFDRKFCEDWESNQPENHYAKFHCSYFRFWQAFIENTSIELRKSIAKNWPYNWKKNNVTPVSAGSEDYDGKLPTGVYQLMSPFLLSQQVDEKFLVDLLMKWWPFFKLSIKREDEIHGWQYIPKEKSEKAVAIEKQFPAKSKIVFLKKALDEEIKMQDGLTR